MPVAALPPCPYAQPNDDDLTGVVTRLGSITTRGGQRPRDPNEPETRWLLEAGVRALASAFLPDGLTPEGPLAYTSARGLFDTLPLDRIMAEFTDMCREQGLDPGSANKARIIRRWSFLAHYQLDLVAYLFRPGVETARVHVAAADLIRMLPDLTFGAVTDRLILQETELVPSATLYRLQRVLQLMFPRDATIRRYSQAQFVELQVLWPPILADIFDRYGLSLAGEMTWPRLTRRLSFLVESAFTGRHGDEIHGVEEDGVPLLTSLTRLIIENATGICWSDLEDRRCR